MELSTPQSRVSLQPILTIIFLNTLGLSIVIPFLVGTVFQLGDNGVFFGLILAAYATFQLIGRPLVTKLTDRIGLKKALLWTETGTFVGWLLFMVGLLMPASYRISLGAAGISISLPLLFVFLSRSIAGLTAGNISLASACLMKDVVHEEQKGYYGKSAVLTNLALIIGPVLGGVLSISPWGNPLAVFTGMMISLASVFIAFFGFGTANEWEKMQPVAPKGDLRRAKFSNGEPPASNLLAVWRLPEVPFVAVLYFLVFVAMSFFYVGFPIFALRDLHWHALDIGLFFAFLTAIPLTINHAVYPYLITRYNITSLIIAGNAFLAAGFILLRVPEIELIYLGGLLFGVGSGILWPSFHFLLCGAVGRKNQFIAREFAIKVGSAARLTGLLGGAILFQFLSSEIFMLAAKIFILAAMFAVRLISLEQNTAIKNNKLN